MKICKVLVIAFLLLSMRQVCAAEMTAEGTAKKLTGANGEAVTIVVLKPRAANKALLAFEGTDSDWDGRVVMSTVQDGNRWIHYKVEWNKNNDWMALEGKGSFSADKNFYIYPPGRPQSRVWYNPKHQTGVNAEEIVQRYLGRKVAGKGTLGAFDREDEVAKEEKTFKDALASMNDACGTQVKGSIDWKSVKDETLQKSKIGSFCAAVLQGMERVCAEELGKNAIKERVTQVSCTVGTKTELKFAGKNLNWTATTDVANQDNFARVYLENNL